MPVIIDYILKLNICLAVVYFFYQLFLRRLTFYNWNRWYLLGYTALSFIIPLIDIMPSLEKQGLQQNTIMQWIPAIGFATPKKQNFFETLSYWDWAIGALLLGSLVLLIRFAIRFYSFKKMKAKAKLISNDVTKIYQLNEPMTPFSFGNSIFINTEMHNGDELEEIIRHEFVHVKQKHTIDIMWCELLCMLNWFNPVVWLLKLSVKQNLEFIADSKVLQNGLDRKEYQYLLLKVMGNRQFAFTNHFNFSSLKKRIAMMNTIKSAKIHLIKFMFLLPVVAVLLLSFRKEVNELDKSKIEQKETLAFDHFSTKGRNVAETLLQQKTIVESDTVPEKKEQMKNTTKKEANIFNLANTGSVTIDQNKIVMKDNPVINLNTKPGEDPLFFLNGESIEKTTFDYLNSNDIESITVLKDASAKAFYGPKATNGVILITTKEGDAKDRTFVAKSDTAIFTSVKNKAAHTFVANTEFPFIKEDDKPTMQDNKKAVLVRAYPIENAKSLKGKVHGITIEPVKEKKHKEVVVVGYSTKDKVLSNPPANAFYVLNGKNVKRDAIKRLAHNTIESVDVLKGDHATKFYGDKAKEGAIIITTK